MKKRADLAEKNERIASKQIAFFEEPTYFDGKTYDPALDKDRLKSLLGRVFDFMLDHDWHTLAEIRDNCGGSEASVSARLRDLRKNRFGAYTIFRKRVKRGLWKYQLKRKQGG
jgi:hypothetical protein